MLFSWAFCITSLMVLLLSKYFFVLSPDTGPLLLTLALVASAPGIIYLSREIKKDTKPLLGLLTREALGGYSILLGVWMILGLYLHTDVSTQIWILVSLFAIYFHVDSRLFFALALAGLITTVWSLVFDMAVWAESASIIVYLCLVIGVLVELTSPLMQSLHRETRPLVVVPERFVHEYRDTLVSYSILLVSALGFILVFLIVFRGIFWDFEFSMLLFFAIGYSILLFLAVTSMRDTPELALFYREETNLLTLLTRYWKYSSILIICALMILVDIAYFRATPWMIQASVIGIGTIILTLVVYSVPYLLPRIRQYTDSSSL